MQVKSLNSLKSVVKEIVPGSMNTEVTLEIASGVEVTTIVTKSSVERLQLSVGKEAYAVIKASDVIIITVDH